MRVLHVIDHLNAGGAQALLLSLAREQRREGIDARVLSLHGPGVHTPAFRAAGIPVAHAAPSRTSPLIPLALVRAVRRARPDVLHAHLVVSCLLCEWMRPVFPPGTAVASHLHNLHGAHGEDRYQDWLEHLAYRRCDVAVCCGRHVARTLRARPGGCRVPIAVAPNAVETSRIQPRDPAIRHAMRSQLRIPPDAPVLLCAGRLVEQKNLAYAVEIAARLSASLPGLRLLVAGEGPRRPELEAAIKRLRAEATVSLLGYRQDLASLMQAADALLLTSHEEGFPMVALEAAAAALPAISTRFSSAHEIVQSSRTGILIPFADSPTAANLIAQALSDPQRLAALGLGAQKLVRARHTIPALSGSIADVYRRLCQPKQRNRQ